MTESSDVPTLIAVFIDHSIRYGYTNPEAISDIFETCKAIDKKVDWRIFAQLADMRPQHVAQVQKAISKEFSVCRKCDGLRRRKAPGVRMKTPCPVCHPEHQGEQSAEG